MLRLSFAWCGGCYRHFEGWGEDQASETSAACSNSTGMEARLQNGAEQLSRWALECQPDLQSRFVPQCIEYRRRVHSERAESMGEGHAMEVAHGSIRLSFAWCGGLHGVKPKV